MTTFNNIWHVCTEPTKKKLGKAQYRDHKEIFKIIIQGRYQQRSKLASLKANPSTIHMVRTNFKLRRPRRIPPNSQHNLNLGKALLRLMVISRVKAKRRAVAASSMYMRK